MMEFYKKNKNIFIFTLLMLMFLPQPAHAMHIMEGFLPVNWAAIWAVIAAPFFFIGIKSINEKVKENPRLKLLLALAGAFVFVLSALKLPSVTGSSSHPTGVGLGAILFGPTIMAVLGTIVLLFQALLLAHGGITTLGANVFSMAVVGPFVAYFAFKLLRNLKAPMWLSVFVGAALGNLFTYVVTATQIALAFPQNGNVLAAMTKFLGIFAVTQIPLAISEGILTVLVFNFLSKYNLKELKKLNIFSDKDLETASERG